MLLDNIYVTFKVEEKVPFDNVGKASCAIFGVREQLLKYITNSNAQGLVRDLQIVLV